MNQTPYTGDHHAEHRQQCRRTRGSNPSPNTAAAMPKENSVTRLMKKIWKPRRDMEFS